MERNILLDNFASLIVRQAIRFPLVGECPSPRKILTDVFDCRPKSDKPCAGRRKKKCRRQYHSIPPAAWFLSRLRLFIPAFFRVTLSLCSVDLEQAVYIFLHGFQLLHLLLQRTILCIGSALFLQQVLVGSMESINVMASSNAAVLLPYLCFVM